MNFSSEPVYRDAATIGHGVAVDNSQLPGAGLGLYATRAFARGAVITMYSGRELGHEEARRLIDAGAGGHLYSVVSHHYVIDGIKLPLEGLGGGPFANDASLATTTTSGSGSQRGLNNAELVHKEPRHGGKELAFVRATRDIAAGEEIFLSYGAGYWRLHSPS